MNIECSLKRLNGSFRTPCCELGLPQSAQVRSGRFQVRNPLSVSDCGVEVTNLGCQECRSALEAGIPLIGRDPIERIERLLETPSLLLDRTQSLPRAIAVLPAAGVGQSREVGSCNIQMARLQRCLRGSRQRLWFRVDRGRALQFGERAR